MKFFLKGQNFAEAKTQLVQDVVAVWDKASLTVGSCLRIENQNHS